VTYRKPRCGKKLRAYRLTRMRDYDYGEVPVCGLPEGHEPHQCVSGESVKRSAVKRAEREKQQRREGKLSLSSIA
jgi:hypothetical protein